MSTDYLPEDTARDIEQKLPHLSSNIKHSSARRPGSSGDAPPSPSQSPTHPPHISNAPPFFTIIEDTTTSQFHHPHIHYIFSDDEDTSLASPQKHHESSNYLTNVLLYRLDPNGLSRDAASHHPDRDDVEEASNEGSGVPDIPENERYLIVDVPADGTDVSVKSLSREWRVEGVELRGAPVFGGEGRGDGEAGLMLKIDGLEAGGVKGGDDAGRRWEDSGREGEGEQRGLVARLQGLMEEYERDMGRLRGMR